MPDQPVTESPAKAKLRATADALKAASEASKSQELATTNKELAEIFHANAKVGTSQMTSEDLEATSLLLLQGLSNPSLPEGEDKKIGYFYRSDTMEQVKEIMVNILCFKKVWADNYKKTAQERKHIYYGSFEGSSDIFRMYVRGGWSLAGSRKFLSEVKRLQLKRGLPMFALKVRLSSAEVHGTMKDTGQPYAIPALVMTVTKDAEGNPNVETDMGRATWLKEMALNFESLNSSDEETETPEPRSIPVKPVEPEPAPEAVGDEKVNPDDIPF